MTLEEALKETQGLEQKDEVKALPPAPPHITSRYNNTPLPIEPYAVFTEADPVTGLVRFMTITEDGRKIPLEDSW